MKITVCVHDPNNEHAPRFVSAALAAGHEIPLVFFYHDGVRVAEAGSSAAILRAWHTLHLRHGLELAICIGAATRRGVASETDRSRVDEHFQVVGLGQLIGALADSDRLVTFSG